jgi:3-methyladenine DNA glycosylase Tag
MTFDPKKELAEMDADWLLNHGWTTDSNLAFRHLIHEYNLTKSTPQLERIEQILMQYNVVSHREKIISALKNFVDLVQTVRNIIDR